MTGSKVDRSFFERKKLQTLIEQASRERVTPEELESIGLAIRETGRRGMDMLVRRLWSERRAEVIRRYTYLLDFYEDEEQWVDNLIEIAVTRRDLDEEGRTVLYQALEELGVDTRSLPLENLPPLGSVSSSQVIGSILDAGVTGTVRVISDIFALDPEFRAGVIDDLATVDDPRVADLLFAVASIDDPEIASAAVRALGRVKNPHVRLVLRQLAHLLPAGELRDLAEKGERRLAFLGVPPPPEAEFFPPPKVTFHAGCPDCYGRLDLLLTFEPAAEERVTTLFLQLHEEQGMVTALFDPEIPPDRFREKREEMRIGTEMLSIPRALALELIRDAIARNREQEMFLPPEYYAARWLLQGEDYPFERRSSTFGTTPVRLSRIFRFFPVGRSILDNPFFGVMLELGDRTYELAREWMDVESQEGSSPSLAERYVDRLIQEVIVPKLDRFPGRLRLAAEILHASHASDSLVRHTLCEATSLAEREHPPLRSPFLRHLAFESLCAARERIAEGYDPLSDDFAGDPPW